MKVLLAASLVLVALVTTAQAQTIKTGDTIQTDLIGCTDRAGALAVAKAEETALDAGAGFSEAQEAMRSAFESHSCLMNFDEPVKAQVTEIVHVWQAAQYQGATTGRVPAAVIKVFLPDSRKQFFLIMTNTLVEAPGLGT